MHIEMRRRRRPFASMLIVAALLGALLLTSGAGTTSAKCPNFDSWPRFSELAPSAKRIVVGTITESGGGVATRIGVEEVLRGKSPPDLDLDRLKRRIPKESKAPCDFDATIQVEVGDRVALAFNGKVAGWKGFVDTAALLDASAAHPNGSGLERLSTGAVRSQAGHAVDGSTVARPQRRGANSGPTGISRVIRDLMDDALVDAIEGLFLVPWPERPPFPLPPGATALELSTQPPAAPHRPTEGGWLCTQAAFGGRIIVVDGALLVEEGSAVWPRGFSARSIDGRGELVSPDGTIVGVEGEVVKAGGGIPPGTDVFVICSVEGVAYPPAS